MSSVLKNQPTQMSFEEANRFSSALREDVSGFLGLARFLKTEAGIHLPPSDKNKSLMAARLAPLMRQNRLDGYADLQRILDAHDRLMIATFINALTTNTTEFFREPQHYDHMREHLRQTMRRKQATGAGDLRIWCAAASTGQEPYSMAMTILETLPGVNQWNLRFLATDIDMEVLQRAADGIYSSHELKTLPQYYLRKYFLPYKKAGEGHYIVNSTMRSLLNFAPLNLMSAQYPFSYKFDFIFCRNVLIYFDRDGVNHVSNRMIKALNPGGYLFVGHSEAGLIKNPEMTSIASAVYRKRMP
jgi:chemotaxis protein methyltransferase CheR